MWRLAEILPLALTDLAHARYAPAKDAAPPPQQPSGPADRRGLGAWRTAVWLRDLGHCRCCGRAVRRIDAPADDRGDCHHVIKRRHAPTRYEPRNGLLLCYECHDRVHGRRRPRVSILSTATYRIGPREYPDMTDPTHVRFAEIA